MLSLRERLSKPENEPKTALGARLRDVRRRLGDPDRHQFAERLGISKNTLAYYERGERTPDADVLASYRLLFRIDVNWLTTGEGEMFQGQLPETLESGAEPLDEALMEKLAHVVWSVYGEAKQKPPIGRVTREATSLFNRLREEVADLSDIDLVEATIPRLRLLLKRRLDDAAREPGTGKRSA
ncbi:XRE family transcriptional regulator [Metarhizobium album]|uniref:XRE family transcriptional regulator n=1 Tax=Metarhizobium album TaxID=2182425 RepID=A0A2U2DFK2_9HYPH|nr:helix-turn-helix transcriptional regulator [Rhizobium album]PWE52058.1 XRE family transcriptional regulator [Rhizobium album]